MSAGQMLSTKNTEAKTKRSFMPGLPRLLHSCVMRAQTRANRNIGRALENLSENRQPGAPA